MRKLNYVLIVATVATIVSGILGFIAMGNPFEEGSRAIDRKRVTDLGHIKTQVESYYKSKYVLPKTIDDALNLYSYNSYSSTDPVTKVAYTYTPLSDMSYKLCATFDTDSHTEEKKTSYSDSYEYSTYRETFLHPKGEQCFTLDVTKDPYYYQPTPYPSYYYPSVSSYPEPTGYKYKAPKPTRAYEYGPTLTPSTYPYDVTPTPTLAPLEDLNK